MYKFSVDPKFHFHFTFRRWDWGCFLIERSKWQSCATNQEGCILEDVFKALSHLVGICIGMLSWSSVLFYNDNKSSKKIWRNLLCLKVVCTTFELQEQHYKIWFCGVKEYEMSEWFFFPSSQAVSFQSECNWNATPIWRRKGNFWQEDAAQLGVLFRLNIDSHSLWGQLSKNSNRTLSTAGIYDTLILLHGVLHIDNSFSSGKRNYWLKWNGTIYYICTSANGLLPSLPWIKYTKGDFCEI